MAMSIEQIEQDDLQPYILLDEQDDKYRIWRVYLLRQSICI